jgi:hypothetical protein
MTAARDDRRGWSAALGLAVVLAGCGTTVPAGVSESFPESHVALAVRFEPSSDVAGTLVATFTPDGEGIHLYGAELPRGGIDGAGLPTLVEVLDAAWRTTGPLVASVDAEAVALAGFDEPFPIYPDGPVTLRLPVERASSGGAASIAASVTFMACTSSGACYLPVRDHPVDIPAR